MENDEIKKYISNINKIIRNGNPKYISYISKEYIKCKRNNPVIATVMEDMIRKEAAEEGSVYAIFIDKDNGINLEAMSDISKITNMPDFIKNVEALAGQNVDFGDLTSDELIIEGMEIAEEIAREIEELENNVDYSDELLETTFQDKVEEKTSNRLEKLADAGVATGGLLAIISKIKEKISIVINRIKNNVNQKKYIEKQEEIAKNEKKDKEPKKENDFIPKIDIDEKAVIKMMNENKSVNKSKAKKFDSNIDSDIDTDTSDDNFDSDNTSQEDDEPDI